MKAILIAVVIGTLALIGYGFTQIGDNVPTVPVAQADATYPEASNYAVDTTGTLTTAQLASLNEILKGMDGLKHQLAVAIVKTTAPLSIEEYGIKLAEKWKVGGRDTDNGAIIIIATEDRKVRIEVGYGLEGDINDAKAGRIIDEHMIPFLKQGDWYGAVVAGLAEINNQIK